MSLKRPLSSDMSSKAKRIPLQELPENTVFDAADSNFENSNTVDFSPVDSKDVVSEDVDSEDIDSEDIDSQAVNFDAVDSKEEGTQKRTGQKRQAPMIFFSAGEPSGDLHAAEIIEEMKRRFPDFQAVGFGGPEMRRVGCDLHVELTKLAVMWFGRVLWNMRTFLGYLKNAGQFFKKERPDAVLLVDFPGFNWLVAKKAKAAGIPVVYFMPPQLWGWGQWRIKKLKARVDHVLCAFPFEENWLKEQGCLSVHRVGHPFLEKVRKETSQHNLYAVLQNQTFQNSTAQNSLIQNQTIPTQTIQNQTIPNQTFQNSTAQNSLIQNQTIPTQTIQNQTIPNQTFQNSTAQNSLIQNQTIPTQTIQNQTILSGELEKKKSSIPILLLLPGSRTQEVTANWDDMFAAVQKIRASVPNLCVKVAAFKQSQADWIAERLKQTVQNKNIPTNNTTNNTVNNTVNNSQTNNILTNNIFANNIPTDIIPTEKMSSDNKETENASANNTPVANDVPVTNDVQTTKNIPVTNDIQTINDTPVINDVQIYVGKTQELIREADCALAVSGSVSVELLAHKKPTVIYYKVGRLGFWVQRWFRRVRYITLVNILAADDQNLPLFYDKKTRFIPADVSPKERGQMVFPEFLTWKDRSDEVAAILSSWLSDKDLRQKKIDEIERLLKKTDVQGSPVAQVGDFLSELLKTPSKQRNT